jgi:hypothetical protein
LSMHSKSIQAPGEMPIPSAIRRMRAALVSE